MGKSLGNAVYLSDDSDTVTAKVKAAKTDESRISPTDKGHPEICTLSLYHKTFQTPQQENICDMCRSGSIGCVACKKLLYNNLNSILNPFREKRAYYESHKNEAREIILAGTQRANVIGSETIARVKEALRVSI